MRSLVLITALSFMLLSCVPQPLQDTENITSPDALPPNSPEAHQAPQDPDDPLAIFIEQLRPSGQQERVNEPKSYPFLNADHTSNLTEEEWKERLTSFEFRVLWRGWTEKPGTGDLLHNKKKGIYVTAGCGLPVFSSDTKYDSGTGWPSFYDVLNESNIIIKSDFLLGYERLEVLSACGEHLGHVFPDGPPPTGSRYCINSAALDFIEDVQT